MDNSSLATIVAVLSGPILAVLVTRCVDKSRLKQTRRMDVFRTLMRTRRVTLNPDHVGALNLVEIEFYGEKAVIDSWKAYWEHLHSAVPPISDTLGQQNFFQESQSLLTKLLHAIAKALRFKIEQLDIMEGGYAPKGWWDDEQAIRELRGLALDILRGQRGIPVVPLNLATQNSPYPPPPEIATAGTT
jgi:hypothetical protein